MTSIEETKRNIRIVFKAQEHINLSLIYNREFFQGIGLADVRVHTGYSKEKLTDNDDTEKIPKKEGWFRSLQEYVNPFVRSANEEPMYTTLLKSTKSLHKKEPNKDVIVLLPKHKFQFVPLKTFLFHRRDIPSIYHYKNSGLDFFHIQNLIKDTMEQMQYMKIKGVFIKSFSVDSFVLINERMFFIDPKRIQFLDTDKEFDDSLSAFLAFFKDILQT
jgi:hypothetical protein